MRRLTLRLPETLHCQLKVLAAQEAVSLNHYIASALTRQVQASHTALLQGLGRAPTSEIERALKQRTRVKPEKGLTPEMIKSMRKRIANSKRS